MGDQIQMPPLIPKYQQGFLSNRIDISLLIIRTEPKVGWYPRLIHLLLLQRTEMSDKNPKKKKKKGEPVALSHFPAREFCRALPSCETLEKKKEQSIVYVSKTFK